MTRLALLALAWIGTSCLPPGSCDPELIALEPGIYERAPQPSAVEEDWQLEVRGLGTGQTLVETFTRDGKSYRVRYRVRWRNWEPE